MTEQAPSYGLWFLVAVNSAIFILFAFSFFKPRTGRDWRSFGAFSAFLVALFTEMYGFPLTIYLLSGWLQNRYPGVDWLAHDSGHLLEMLFGWKANPHFGPFHLLSFALIGGGFLLIAAAWPVLYEAQGRRALATSGPYAYLRHPQYAGFALVMIGFFVQWPTLVTALMFAGAAGHVLAACETRGAGGRGRLRRCLPRLRRARAGFSSPHSRGDRQLLVKRKESNMQRQFLRTALLPIAALWTMPVWAQGPADRDWMWHPAWGWGHMMFGGLMMIVFWGSLIVLVVLLVRWLSGGGGALQSRSSALQILQERFARGEIDKEEYEERRKILNG